MKWIVAVLVALVLGLGVAGGYEIVDLRDKLSVTQANAHEAQQSASNAQQSASNAQQEVSRAQSDADDAAQHAGELDQALCEVLQQTGIVTSAQPLENC